MQNLTSAIIGFIIKLILTTFGVVFAVSLLLAALVAVVFSLLKSLITWQKPAPFVVYRQFRQDAPGGWPFAQKPVPQSDVVDVEVSEVKESESKRIDVVAEETHK